MIGVAPHGRGGIGREYICSAARDHADSRFRPGLAFETATRYPLTLWLIPLSGLLPVGQSNAYSSCVSELDSIEDNIVVALRRIIRAIDIQSRRMVDSCGLTGPQVVVLRGAARLGAPSVSTLARSVSLSQPTVSGIVERLEKRGLLKRERSEQDRRSVVVTLTSEGNQILVSVPPLLQDRFRRELDHLEEWEQTQILATLQRLAGMMDAESIDAAPMLETGAIGSDGSDPSASPHSADDNF